MYDTNQGNNNKQIIIHQMYRAFHSRKFYGTYYINFSFSFSEKSLIISAFVGEHLSSASFTLIYMKITTAVSAGRSPKCRLYLEPSHNLKNSKHLVLNFCFLMSNKII